MCRVREEWWKYNDNDEVTATAWVEFLSTGYELFGKRYTRYGWVKRRLLADGYERIGTMFEEGE